MTLVIYINIGGLAEHMSNNSEQPAAMFSFKHMTAVCVDSR